MSDRAPPSQAAALAAIGLVLVAAAGAFAYVAGWLTPGRITPALLVDSLAPASGPAPGYRRNHAKGICFTGRFDANGLGTALSKTPIFRPGPYPVTGRFNLGAPDPTAPDGMQRIRGLGLRILGPDRQEWRMAMIDAPFFPVATPQAFYELQKALAHKSAPGVMKNFVTAHPEFGAFVHWAGSAPFTASYAEERYNSLDSFVFTDAADHDVVVRWSFVPAAPPETLSEDDLKSRDADFLEQEIVQRLARQVPRWTMLVTVADASDPTADPSKAWPDERRTVEVGTLVVNHIESQAAGPCRDINFDPTVLPAGVRVSDDPFPAARSAAYSVSFNRRTAEEADSVRDATGGHP